MTEEYRRFRRRYRMWREEQDAHSICKTSPLCLSCAGEGARKRKARPPLARGSFLFSAACNAHFVKGCSPQCRGD